MLVLLHIPKTAGTTLHKILAHQFRRSRTVIRHDAQGPLEPGLAARLRGERGAPVDLLMGHLGAWLHHEVPGVEYVVCLREPLARLRSHYHFARAHADHYLHAEIAERRLSFAGYAASGLSGELRDGMVRCLAGVRDFDRGEMGAAQLDAAKELIETRCRGCVVTERFDESVVLLAGDLKLRPPYYLRRKVGRYHDGAAGDEADGRAAVALHNRMDMELIRFANDWLDRKVAGAGPDFPRRVERFRRLNRLWGRLVFLVREARHRSIG
jgi:hypothetical protein